jgi:hypothetical protein
LLFKIAGKKSARIQLLNTDTSKAKTKVEFGSGAVNSALVVAR